MFAVNFYASCLVIRGNSIGKKLVRLDWEKAVYRPLFTLANTLYIYISFSKQSFKPGNSSKFCYSIATPWKFNVKKQDQVVGTFPHSTKGVVTYPELFWADIKPKTTSNPKCTTMVDTEQKKNSKFLPPNALKMHSPTLSGLRFFCKTFSKLLRFTLQNTLLCR